MAYDEDQEEIRKYIQEFNEKSFKEIHEFLAANPDCEFCGIMVGQDGDDFIKNIFTINVYFEKKSERKRYNSLFKINTNGKQIT